MFVVAFAVVVMKMMVQIHIVFVKTVGCTVIVVMKKGDQTHIVFVRVAGCMVIVVMKMGVQTHIVFVKTIEVFDAVVVFDDVVKSPGFQS